jgi:hypothetical protein
MLGRRRARGILMSGARMCTVAVSPPGQTDYMAEGCSVKRYDARPALGIAME